MPPKAMILCLLAVALLTARGGAAARPARALLGSEGGAGGEATRDSGARDERLDTRSEATEEGDAAADDGNETAAVDGNETLAAEEGGSLSAEDGNSSAELEAPERVSSLADLWPLVGLGP